MSKSAGSVGQALYCDGGLGVLPTVVASIALDDIYADEHTPRDALNNVHPPGVIVPTVTDNSNAILSNLPTALDNCGRQPFYRPRHQGSVLYSRHPASSPPATAQSADDDVKRKKNREAAARCRQRKMLRVSMLEEKAKQLKEDNEELEREASLLQNQIRHIHNLLIEHKQSGCPI